MIRSVAISISYKTGGYLYGGYDTFLTDIVNKSPGNKLDDLDSDWMVKI
jgi:hypothetical protein